MLVRELFAEYVEWLRVNVPHAHANLAPGASDADIEVLEAGIGARLPEDVRTVLGMHNGQRETMVADRAGFAVPCLPTLMFLSTDLILRAWRTCQEMGDAVPGEVFPSAEGVVKPLYSSPGWIPLWGDPVGADYVGLDLDPGPKGTSGQIINFGRDEECHFVCADDFAGLISILHRETVVRGAWRAATIDYGGGSRPWFGDPEEHFFNTLHAHSAEGSLGD